MLEGQGSFISAVFYVARNPPKERSQGLVYIYSYIYNIIFTLFIYIIYNNIAYIIYNMYRYHS